LPATRRFPRNRGSVPFQLHRQLAGQGIADILALGHVLGGLVLGQVAPALMRALGLGVDADQRGSSTMSQRPSSVFSKPRIGERATIAWLMIQ
jgi:hypothetical protein